MKHVGYMTVDWEGDFDFYKEHPVFPRGTMEPVWKIYSEVAVNQLLAKLDVATKALQVIASNEANAAVALLALNKVEQIS